jgi:hypothetical protein
VLTVGDTDLAATSGLVCLAASNGDDEAFLGELQVAEVYVHDFASAHCARESKQDERSVSKAGKPIGQAREHLFQISGEGGGFARDCLALVSEDTSPDSSHTSVGDRIWLAGRLVDLADNGEPTTE